MIQFFQQILGYIEILFNFLISFISGIIQLIALIPATIVTLTSVFGYMPSFISAPLMVFAGFCLFIALFHFWGNVG